MIYYTRIRRGMLMLGLLLGLFAGCSATTQPPAGLTQTVDGLTVTLTATTHPVVAIAQSWQIMVTDSTGAPVDDAEVYLEMVMPGMPMGQQNPWAAPQRNGLYTAQGAYTMEGSWQMIVHVEINQIDHVVPFQIDVRP